MTPVCVLRSGGDFGPEHVQWLARQVPGLTCLSDVAVPGVETRPLLHDWPGWWAKMEMFGPALQGDVLMIDLDTVVRELPAAPVRTTVLGDFTEPGIIGSGLMYVTAEDRARVWDAWTADPAGHMASCTRWPRWGDQGFLMDHLADAARWQDSEPVYSYKAHCRGSLPADAKVVCFHGKPRPWDVRAAWVPPLYGAPALRDFRELILAHAGKRFVVMGGGPSLQADLQRIGSEPDDVVISTNGHGVALRAPDYLLAIDHTHTAKQVPMGEYLRPLSDAPIISPHSFADFRLGFWPDCPRFVLSGLVATWAAFAMGARVVVLAGMDGYADNDYRDEARKIARDIHCPVRVMAESPLADVWPAFNSRESFMDYEPHSSIDGLKGLDGRIRIRVVKPCTIGRIDFPKDAELVCMRHEVARLLKHRMVVELESVEDEPPAEDPPVTEPTAEHEPVAEEAAAPAETELVAAPAADEPQASEPAAAAPAALGRGRGKQ